MFKAIKRLFVALGLWAEKATETDAINEAQVEAGIRESKSKAEKANFANGQLAGQIGLLRDQCKRQEMKVAETRSLLQASVAANDDANGASYAEELATQEAELTENQGQLKALQETYAQNTQIIANSIREIQKFQREFEAVKAKVAMGRSMANLATMMQSSITELQGMGGEMGKSMEQLRQSAAGGMGQITATMDLAKALGSDIARQQEAKKIRGNMLLQQYKQKMGMVNAEAAATPPAAATPAKPAERQKIAE
jgi:predicted RNase H-like nuclease (RuvC/YqgF family)